MLESPEPKDERLKDREEEVTKKKSKGEERTGWDRCAGGSYFFFRVAGSAGPPGFKLTWASSSSGGALFVGKGKSAQFRVQRVWLSSTSEQMGTMGTGAEQKRCQKAARFAAAYSC
jgi:hypothetical protein